MHRHKEHRDSIDAAFDALLEKSFRAYVEKQEAFAEAIAPFSAWGIDEDTATLTMENGQGEVCRFQITPIGTYLPESENFAWAWSNSAFPEACRNRASRIRELAASTGYGIFETPHFAANSTDVDELCALALAALSGRAVFKAKSSVPWAYYVVA